MGSPSRNGVADVRTGARWFAAFLDGGRQPGDIIQDTTYHLTFALSGSTLELYDGGRLVASVVDPALIPATSYVGMQSSTPTGQTSFGAATVTALPHH
jgi:hypothetical protein